MTASAKLIICPTPLGNLSDLSPHALAALRSCDTVCAEDTRVTGRLLAAFDIEKRLERLDEAVLGQRCQGIMERVAAGETIAYCSDAGMPGVSDPGQRLVDAALDAGVPVEVIAGPTAVTTAYVASGFTCPRFYFAGFFPRKESERMQSLHKAAALEAVVLYYESPHRLISTLGCIAKELPLRRIAVCRELTKVHEEVVRGTADRLCDMFASREGGVKGEIVIAIDVAGSRERTQGEADCVEDARRRADELLEFGQMSKKDIVSTLREEFGIARNEAYDLVHRP